MIKKLCLDEIIIKDFRNIKNLKISFNPNYNEITGCNGTGKSTIIDAILCMFSKKNENLKFINKTSEMSRIDPLIYVSAKLDNRELSLKYENNNWYIDGIKQNSKSDYLKTISNKLDIDEDRLYLSLNPTLISEKLLGKRDKKDRDEIRGDIILLVNSLAINESDKINNDELKNLLNEIENKNEKLKEFKNDIVYYEKKSIEIKENTPELKDWNLDTSDNFDSNELNNIINKIAKYDDIRYEIKSKRNEEEKNKTKLWEINNKLENINNAEESNNQNSHNKKLPLFILILLWLTIIGGLVWLFLRKIKKSKYQNHNVNNLNISEINELNQNKKNLEKINRQLCNEINELHSSNFYKDIDYDELLNQKRTYEAMSNESVILLSRKKDYKDNEDIVLDLKHKQKKVNDELILLKNKKVNIGKKVNNIMKSYFPNFDIDLFKDDGSEFIVIKNDGIPLDYLNNSKKTNIFIEIGEFLKKKNPILTFSLIDNAESVNEIYKPKDGQIIATKVNYDSVLKINGKNIY